MKNLRKIVFGFASAVFLVFGTMGLTGCGGTSIGVDVPLENTVWILDSYVYNGQSHSVLWNTRITAYFSAPEHVVRGSGGCNTYSGDYELTTDNLSIRNVISTLIGCPASIEKQEESYLDLIGKASIFKIDGSTLTITCSNGELGFKP